MSGPIQDQITAKLRDGFPQAVHIEVVNESSSHAVPRGSETHFRIVVVCKEFEGLGRLARHRALQKVIEVESTLVKAISLRPHTPAEWADMGGVAGASPNCRGG